MSIISLTIAPLLANNEDWQNWYYGLIPLFVMIIGTIIVYYMFWREGTDIMADMDATDTKKEDGTGGADAGAAVASENEETA